MSNPQTITSANSTLTLAVANLFPVPQNIQGFATDAMFDGGDVEIAEGKIGADGLAAYGFIFNLQTLTIELLANSPSRQFFADLVNATKAAREVYTISGSILVPSINMKVTLVNGTLKSYPPFPAAKKTLEDVRYVLMFQDMLEEATA